MTAPFFLKNKWASALPLREEMGLPPSKLAPAIEKMKAELDT